MCGIALLYTLWQIDRHAVPWNNKFGHALCVRCAIRFEAKYLHLFYGFSLRGHE